MDYVSDYGVRHNRDQFDRAFPGPLRGLGTGTVNLIRDGVSAAGDFANYIEVDCKGLTEGNFKEKLGQFKESIYKKIQKHNGITNISMDCLLKNDKYSKYGNDGNDGKPVIVSVAKYNSVKGNWSPGHEKMMDFSKEQQINKSGAGAKLLTIAVSFDNILEETFTWDTLAKLLNGDDSIRMVISKKGLDDIKKGTITICDDIGSSAGRRRRSSRKYKKSNRNVKSSKKRSYTTKYSRTRRYRK